MVGCGKQMGKDAQEVDLYNLCSIPIFDMEERNARKFRYGQFTEEHIVAEVQQLISCRLCIWLALIVNYQDARVML